MVNNIRFNEMSRSSESPVVATAGERRDIGQIIASAPHLDELDLSRSPKRMRSEVVRIPTAIELHREPALWHNIAPFLDIASLGRVATVDKVMKQIFTQTEGAAPSLQEQCLLEQIVREEGVGFSIDQALDRIGLPLIVRERVQHLDFSNDNAIGIGELEDLVEAFPNIKTLKFKECPDMSNEHLEVIAGWTQLEILHLIDSKEITGEGLEHLAPLGRLRILDLTGCDKLENGSLSNLAPFENLEELYIGLCPLILDEDVEHLGGLQRLRILHVDGSPITDECCATLRELEALEELNVENCPHFSQAAIRDLCEVAEVRGVTLTVLPQIVIQ